LNGPLPILNHFGASDDGPAAAADVEGNCRPAVLPWWCADDDDAADDSEGMTAELCLDGGSGVLHHTTTSGAASLWQVRKMNLRKCYEEIRRTEILWKCDRILYCEKWGFWVWHNCNRVL